MLELPHMLIGATIASKVGNPLLSLPLALGSHFVADLMPHWNPHLYRETQKYGKPTRRSIAIVVIDSVLSLFLGVYIASQALPEVGKFLVILAASFLAVVPDVLEAPYFFLGIKPKWILNLINWQRQHQMEVPVVLGLLVEGIIVGVCLWLLLG